MNSPIGIGLRTRRDSFFRGRFEVLQPVDKGHRAGSDALLLAAGLKEDAGGRLADLGAGVGVAGIAALVANPALEAVLVEIDPVMADLARRSLQLSANSYFAARASVLEADATLTGEKRLMAGLANNAFDHVVMNPPYNHAGQRPSPDEMRSLAHSMGEVGLDSWLRTASAILKPGGTLLLIWRTERLGDVLAGMQGRFGDISIMPLFARDGDTASRIVVRATRGSRAPLSISRGVVLHEADGGQSAIADRLLNGTARLPFGD
ncbi:MAG: methyltransferase [Nitratireductor sp.]|nr:methyltransferase [Nitratireductor sp.]